jgi:hypothetical protein
VYSKEAAEELKQLRMNLADAETEAARAVANSGKASKETNDKVAGILHRIQELTGEHPADGTPLAEH